MSESIYDFICEMVGEDVVEHDRSQNVINSRDRRKNITTKLFLPSWIADIFHQIDPAYSFILAKIFRDEFILSNENLKEFGLEKTQSIRIRTETICKEKKLRIEKDILERIQILEDISHFLASEASNSVNIKKLDWGTAASLSKVHHIDIENVEFDLDDIITRTDEKGGERFIEFPDGWYWVNTMKEYSAEEANMMSHCGRDSGTQIISLRDPSGRSHITVSRKPEKKALSQCRGKKNQKPSRKYHEYITALLLNKRFPFDDVPVNADTRWNEAFWDINRQYALDAGDIESTHGMFSVLDLTWNPKLFRLLIKYSSFADKIQKHTDRILYSTLLQSKPDNLEKNIQALVEIGALSSVKDLLNHKDDLRKVLIRFSNKAIFYYTWIKELARILGLQHFNSQTSGISELDATVLDNIYRSKHSSSVEYFKKLVEEEGYRLDRLLEIPSITYKSKHYYKFDRLGQDAVKRAENLCSILSHAVSDESIPWIECLISVDKDALLINSVDPDGLSPIHRIFSGYTQVFEVLDAGLSALAKNPNVNYHIRSAGGKSPMHFMALDPTQLIQPMLDMLQKHGLSIDDVDHNNRTILSYAAEMNKPTLVETLLKNGASLTVACAEGNNPLHYAVLQDSAKMMEILVKHDQFAEAMSMTNNAGLTPLQLSKVEKKTMLTTTMAINNISYEKDIVDESDNTAIDNRSDIDDLIDMIIETDDVVALNNLCKNEVLTKYDFMRIETFPRIRKMIASHAMQCLFYVTQRFNIPTTSPIQLHQDPAIPLSEDYLEDLKLASNFIILNKITDIADLRRFATLTVDLIENQKAKLNEQNKQQISN